jgi:hypothetical protein
MLQSIPRPPNRAFTPAEPAADAMMGLAPAVAFGCGWPALTIPAVADGAAVVIVSYPPPGRDGRDDGEPTADEVDEACRDIDWRTAG